MRVPSDAIIGLEHVDLVGARELASDDQAGHTRADDRDFERPRRAHDDLASRGRNKLCETNHSRPPA
jgi:hypothetical protein